MYYNFNQHKEKNRTNVPSQKELAPQLTNSVFALLVDRLFKRLAIKWQRTLVIVFISAGCLYSAYLIFTSIFGLSPTTDLDFVLERFSTPTRADPSDWMQAHEFYLDSLEAAFLKDSINQSQFQHQDADTNLFP